VVRCTSCGAETQDGGRFCASCGRSLETDLTATADAVPTRVSTWPSPKQSNSSSSGIRSTPSRPASSSGLSTEGRFLPGTQLSGRYRIVALLGKGGMGEVYRADDLTLGQPVALKFLPESVARDATALERFKNEVRSARRVSNPNVCRVYDVGEANGQTFLSMEYVDGEDLASLLRRIGRLPGDKALEIGRQLCAGLAAAHREGVLHRDLKPANIMLDGRGRAVMTDFGLASLAGQVEGYDVRSGTPAYMAPEQLAGKEVTAQSDIYSLGLVLYEIFTGKRAFDADSLAALVKQRAEKPISSPSTWVKDLDPAVERVIMRCLDADPAQRPSSALAVAAALPGGDPLAAALAAGETPSPQMVAAAGEKEAIAPRSALTALAAAIVGMVIVTASGIQISGLRMMNLPLPPDVLSEKAREIINTLGYTEVAVDHGGEFYYNTDFTDYVHNHDRPRPDWPKVLAGQPAALQYAYRQSPNDLDADGFHDESLTPGVVVFFDPPETESGMINIIVDPQGRLTYFQAIPKEVQPNPPPAKPVDWKPLFTAAGLNLASLHPALPQWLSLAAFDERAAWTGTWPGSNLPLRVEAAAWRGRAVFFKEIGPWTTPDHTEYSSQTAGQHASTIMEVVVLILLLAGGSLLARRNYTSGKADVHGALRLASAVFALEIAIWLCEQHFVPALTTFGRFVLAVSTGLFISAGIWMLYLALEPYVRRHWPHAIISWSRLLAGRVRDPIVGRDVLWGVLLAMAWGAVIDVGLFLLKREGATPDLPSLSFISGPSAALSGWLLHILEAIITTLEFFFVMFLLRVVLRNKWLAAAAFVAIFATMATLSNDHPQYMGPMYVIVFSIAAFAVSRFGLVTLAVGIFAVDTFLSSPFTLDFSRWYSTTFLAVFLSILAIALWGFYASLGGQKLWQNDMFE
jgi:serine/threonine protein kinase